MTTKVGEYSKETTLTSRPWLSKVPGNAISIGGDKKKQDILVYTIFEDLANIVEDIFWKDIFIKCSKDKFPKGFLYRDNNLTFKKGVKIIKMEVIDNNEETAKKCIEFFQKHSGIFSNNDKLKFDKLLQDHLKSTKSIYECKWSDIRKKYMKDILIREYIDDLCEKHNYNDYEKKKLQSEVGVGIALGYIVSKNIIFEKGHITKIEGLIFDEEDNTYKIDKSKKPRKSKSKACVNKKDYNYLEYFEIILKSLIVDDFKHDNDENNDNDNEDNDETV